MQKSSVEKLKILHVYKSLDTYNGLMEILEIMAGDMDQDRFELAVCADQYEGNSFGERFQRKGGKIHSLGLGRKAAGTLAAFHSLRGFLRASRPHLVQTHALRANFLGSAAARSAQVPAVIGTEMTLKDTAPTALRRLRDHLVHPLAERAMRRCDRVVVTSRFIRDQWCRKGDDSRFEVLYPPFSLEKYELAGKPSRRRAAGKRIGYVGRLSEEKAVETLLRAFAAVSRQERETRLTIVGTGPEEGRLKTLSAELGISRSVTFTGYLPSSFRALRDMDVFVLPSRSEGCPIVVLEAMAMNLPVVATSVGGNPELVRNGGSGLLVPPGNPADMAAAILSLVRNRQAALTMGQAGHDRAFGEFHPARFTERLQQLYLELCGNRLGAACRGS